MMSAGRWACQQDIRTDDVLPTSRVYGPACRLRRPTPRRRRAAISGRHRRDVIPPR
jgi:hypothetical protein